MRLLAFVFLAISVIPQFAVAQDIAEFQGDSTVSNLADNYSIVEVRQAIAKCKAGKFDEAIPVLQQYANSNDIGASYVLAKLHTLGLGVQRSNELAQELLSANVSSGHGPSMTALAEIKEIDSSAEAVELYKRAAGQGQAIAFIKLGNISENGLLGLRANPRLAFKYYEKASSAGHAAGDFQMARCYEAGIGVSADAVTSTRLYRKAAMAGVPIANTVMARRYFEGQGVEADPVAAIGWLTRGTQAGSTEAMVLLGQRYELGDVIGQDLNRAGQLYSTAAKMGDPTGTYKLAMMYLNGIGTKSDPVRAFVLLEGAQALPMAKTAYEQLKGQLTPNQLELAKKKIEEAKIKK